VRKYYLQFYSHDWDPGNQDEQCSDDRLLIDDLPLPPLLVERLVSIGVIEPKDRKLTLEEVERIYRILRIRQSLGVNLSGAAIIIELMDRLEAMEEEINRQGDQ
jgi:MerR family transcriptional regulator/heat shock protein HspR